MKIHIAQQNYRIGDFNGNFEKMVISIDAARNEQCDLIIFSELSLCGFFPYHLLHYNSFFNKCTEYLTKIKELSKDIGILVGAPRREEVNGEEKLYNSAYLFSEIQEIAIIDKFYGKNNHLRKEQIYFSSSDTIPCVEFKGVQIAVTLGNPFGDIFETNSIYNLIGGSHLHINLNATPFTYLRELTINNCISEIDNFLPTICCNTIGSSDGVLFAGKSQVFSQDKSIVLSMSKFKEGLQCYIFKWEEEVNSYNIKTSTFSAIDINSYFSDYNIESIYEALIFGIQDYFIKNNFSKAILGSSGGIDSAVVLALLCHALKPENVTAMLMPSAFSTGHSVDDAVLLSKNLKNPFHVISIKDIYDSTLNTLKPLFLDLPFNVAEENIQARIRCLLLMAESNKFGSILINTSNKSEAAVGYGTLYGDTAGSLSVLGDLYKTQVYALARYINRNGEIIPNHIITKAPSAELRPDQVDSDSLPDYETLDQLLYQHLERNKDEAFLVNKGFDQLLVKKIINMVNRCEFKRAQFCPVLKVSPVTFGIDRQIPIINDYFK